jgi:hypothetical protein
MLSALSIVPTVNASDAISPDTKVSLFNGKNLEGWRSWLREDKDQDPKKVFSVQNGAIRISGDGLGYLATENSYRDYRLVVEFRWGSKTFGDRTTAARDSGLFLHSQGPDGNSHDGDRAYKAAIECQIMQGAVGDFLIIKGRDATKKPIAPKLSVRAIPDRDADGWPTFAPNADSTRVETTQLSGTGRVNWCEKDQAWKDKLDFRGPRDIESRTREWTRVECECRGDAIRVYVNGSLVNEVSGVSISSGPILLQCEGSEIEFRRVELHPLDAAPRGQATGDYATRNLAGWTVHVNRQLLAKDELCGKTLELLARQLYDIRRMVPAKPLAELEKIPFWLELADPRHPCACYHISPEWLKANGFSVDKAGAVEIANAQNFLDWTKQQPWMVLHELTHGYHHRVLTHEYAPLRDCYRAAMKDKKYESVLDYAGRRRKAYAANNVEEYFAEATEAFFGTNDFYPFVRPELREHDPELYRVLERIWTN